MRRTVQITNVEGAGSQGVFSAQLPMGLDYFAFYFVDTNAAALVPDISNIKHFMGSDIMRDLTGTQQQQINLSDILDPMATDGIFPLHLDMLSMKTIQATYGPTMNTLSPDADTGRTITSSRLELTLGGANVPAWQLFADVDDAGAGGPGFVERVRVYGNLTIGTSEKSFATVLPFGTPDVRFWRRIFITNVSAGNITLGRLLRSSENNEVFKRSRTLDARILSDYKFRVNGTGVNFSLDGTETGIPEMWDTMIQNPLNKANGGKSDGVPMFMTVGQMDLRLTNSAAATADIILNTMGKY
jgi:hypothetical protein